jgi:hypothetical protein
MLTGETIIHAYFDNGMANSTCSTPAAMPQPAGVGLFF